MWAIFQITSYDFGGWNHYSAEDLGGDFFGSFKYDDEKNMVYNTFVTKEEEDYVVNLIRFPAYITPSLSSTGRGYAGAYAYDYGSAWIGEAYNFSYNLAQIKTFSSLFVSNFAPFDPSMYYDGTTRWAVDVTGRITGEYEEEEGMFLLGGKKIGKGLGFAKGKKAKSSAEADYRKNGAEHVSGKSPSKRNDHEIGRARNQRDRGGEKGDKRRTRYK